MGGGGAGGVDPEGDARWFGDEAMVLARRSGAPVFVAANRYEAGLLAEKNAGDDQNAVHVLDDGFQHLGAGTADRYRPADGGGPEG